MSSSSSSSGEMDSEFVYHQIPVIVDLRSGSDSNIGSSTSTSSAEQGILSTSSKNGGSVKKIEPDTTALIHIPFTKPKSVNPDVINFTEDFMVELATDYNRQNQGLVKVPEEHDNMDDSLDDDDDPPGPGPYMPYANKRQKQAFRRYFATNPFPPPDKDSCKKDGENRKSKSKKRRRGPPDTGVEHKKSKTTLSILTPTQKLNEIFPALVYVYSEATGPPHEPVFEVTVVYPPNGKEYKSNGRSKKQAKHNVSEVILADIGQPFTRVEVMEEGAQNENVSSDTGFQEDAQMMQIDQRRNHPVYEYETPQNAYARMMEQIDFASDDLPMICPVNAAPIPEPTGCIDEFLNRLRKVDIIEVPSAALNSLLGSVGTITYEFFEKPEDSSRPAHQQKFNVKLTVLLPTIHTTCQTDLDSHIFYATASSKKGAKHEASRLALMSLLGPECYNSIVDHQSKHLPRPPTKAVKPSRLDTATATSPDRSECENVDESDREYSLVFAQKMAKIVHQKYGELVKNDEKYAASKVTAGVVMTLGNPLIDNMHVISVATGTKCIEGDYMSDQGLSVNDCHAEILATRCLRDFIFSQIEALRNMSNWTDVKPEAMDGIILEKIEQTTEDEVTRYKLKENVQFHLYISTSPCGDARIFAPNGVELPEEEEESNTPPSSAPGEEVIDTHPNRVNRGLLRAKIEAAEGTIPVSNLRQGPQTWDEILMGNALYTMSCSDKICKWNAIGFQGALLSNLMDPIYYSSIVLGSLHHPVHFKRAMFGRLENLKDLKLPFKVNQPKLLMVADKTKRRVTKSPNHSITWTCCWNSHEVLASSKGRCENTDVASRLTKRVAFIRFLKIYKNETGRRDNFLNVSYIDAKNLAQDYQESKKKFLSSMKENNYGIWISKPFEQDHFFM